ncbi:MAG: hypothetical protein ACRCS0_03495 [Albidovulum sp.]
MTDSSAPPNLDTRHESRGNATLAMRGLPWVIVAIAVAILYYRSQKFGGHFPDDAYISFRFAEHVARGLGIVWNESGPPTEGSTSFLQTMLSALGFRLGLGPHAIAAVLSTVSVAALIVVVYRIFVHLTGGFGLAAALAVALFVSGVNFAIHANSGMETIMSVPLLAGSFLAALSLLGAPDLRKAVVLALVNFLCLWCRPDAAPFLAGQGVVLFIASVAGGKPGLLRPALLSYVILGAMGTVFLIWKYSYFGYLLPNSFYVKATAPMTFAGLGSVGIFLRDFLIHASLLLPLLLFVDWRAIGRAMGDGPTARAALLFVPVLCFLAYNTTTMHIVNFNYRFEFPVALFLWIGLGWLMTAGRAVERLQSAAMRLGGASVSVAVTTLLVLAMIAATYAIDRRQHGKWFAYMQMLHYEPVAAALARTGAGAGITLLYDAAGYIAFASKVSFLDPVGLCDNTLSGRVDLTSLQREEYIWGQKPDVYLGPVPPASPGAGSAAEEPLLETRYAERILLNRDTFADYGHYMDEMTPQEARDAMHYRMRELRERYIAVGEIPYPLGADEEYTHFLFVRADSPFRDKLVAELAKVVTRPLAEIDFNDVTKGQRPLTLKEAQSLSVMP